MCDWNLPVYSSRHPCYPWLPAGAQEGLPTESTVPTQGMTTTYPRTYSVGTSSILLCSALSDYSPYYAASVAVT